MGNIANLFRTESIDSNNHYKNKSMNKNININTDYQESDYPIKENFSIRPGKKLINDYNDAYHQNIQNGLNRGLDLNHHQESAKMPTNASLTPKFKKR